MNSSKYNVPQYEPNFEESDRLAVEVYLRGHGWCSEGRAVHDFERAVSKMFNTSNTVAVPNGTIALCLVARHLRAIDRQRKKIIVPSYTMIATVNAFLESGFNVDIVDIKWPSLEMDTDLVEARLRSNGRMYAGICYVPPNGRFTADTVEHLTSLSEKYDVPIICDAAQAIGINANSAELQLPDVFKYICCSFAPSKIVSTGQGGTISTSNDSAAEWMRSYKAFGRGLDSSRVFDDFHVAPGLNYRFNDLQATLGISQLNRFKALAEEKRSVLETYAKGLSDRNRGYLLTKKFDRFIPWFIEFVTPSRDSLIAAFERSGIQSRKMYPRMSSQPTLRRNRRVSFYEPTLAVSKRVESEGLWLPSGYRLNPDIILQVCSIINEH